MKSIGYFLIIFFCLFCYDFKAQTLNNKIVIDTLYQNEYNKGLFTIEQDLEIKNNLEKYKLLSCNSKNTIKNKIIIRKEDIANVPMADKCILTPKIMGYKIQIHYTKDRGIADKVKGEFNYSYPSLASEVKYLQPDFKVLVGDYLSKKSASVYLNKIKRKYSGAFIIPFPVRCRIAE